MRGGRSVIEIRKCVGCGCTDVTPCLGGCRWTGINEETDEGLCSACAARPLDQLMSWIGFSPMTEQEQLLALLQNAKA
jgi:hypothetical protein